MTSSNSPKILSSDPRLRGHPQGGVYLMNATIWHVRIVTAPDGMVNTDYSEYLHASDFGGDMDAAKTHGEFLLQQASDGLNLTRNQCVVLENGDISMDLGQGYSMIFDPEKLDTLIPYKWYAAKNGKGIYANTKIDGKTVQAHRLIMNATSDIFIDHRRGTTLKDGKTLDNRVSNLRPDPHRNINPQNLAMREDNKTGEIGVNMTKNRKGQITGFMVGWHENGNKRSKRFVLTKSLNHEEALTKAKMYRHGKEALLNMQTRRVSNGEIPEAYTAAAIKFVLEEDARYDIQLAEMKQRHAKIAEMLGQDVSMRKMAEDLGVPYAMVKRVNAKLKKSQCQAADTIDQSEPDDSEEPMDEPPTKKQRTLDDFVTHV
jgi:hypothetical protein